MGMYCPRVRCWSQPNCSGAANMLRGVPARISLPSELLSVGCS